MVEDSSADFQRWIGEARAGSHDALGQALEACRFYLLMVAEQEIDPTLHAKGGASDIVQETYLEAQRAFPRFHGNSEEELLAWLRRMLVNNIADFRRRYRGTDKRDANREIGMDRHGSSRDWRAMIPAECMTPSGEFARQEDHDALQKAMLQLPDDYQTVLRLRYVEGLPFDAIADRMSRTAPATRKLFGRAVERLQRELDESP